MKHKGICPVSVKKTTLGVMHRIEELADRKHGFKPEHARPFCSTIPLREIIAEIIGRGPKSNAVDRDICNSCGHSGLTRDPYDNTP